MKATIHPAVFLSGCIVFCALWLSLVPVESPPVPAGVRRTAQPERATITLDPAILERYSGTYEGRGGFTVDLTVKDGKLLGQAQGTVPFELGATSETEFFIKSMGYAVEFDVADDGTVRGFAASTEYGLIEVKRVR
jgi:hypothetical protein